MKRRVVAALLATMMVVSMCACGTGNSEKDQGLEVASGIPEYADDKQLEMAAYCGPRGRGYRFWNGEYGTYAKDPEGGWEGWINQEWFQAYMDCEFTYLMPEYDAPYDTQKDFEKSDLYKYMELAESMNIPVLVYSGTLVNLTSSPDPRLTDDQKEMLKKMVDDLSQFKVFKGFSFRDEPSIDMAKSFASVKEYLDSLNPNLHYYTSLLPIYVKDASVLSKEHADNKEEAYLDYVDTFSNAIGNFAYDSYPLISDPVRGETMVDGTWFQNLRLVAENAKEKNYDAGITIQACGFGPAGQEEIAWHKRRVDSKADITFQLYTALAYGYKEINYYTFWEHWMASDTEEHYTGMVEYPEKNGEEPVKTPAYYAVQEANQEVKKFDHVILNFNWEGTMPLTAEGKTMSVGLQSAGDYESPRIDSASATDEAIIGCMKDKDGYDGFMIVNATDPAQKLKNKVTVKFKKASKALAYVNGEEQTITLENGECTFELEEGAGVFVIPIQ